VSLLFFFRPHSYGSTFRVTQPKHVLLAAVRRFHVHPRDRSAGLPPARKDVVLSARDRSAPLPAAARRYKLDAD
jgi:hypothetical protein